MRTHEELSLKLCQGGVLAVFLQLRFHIVGNLVFCDVAVCYRAEAVPMYNIICIETCVLVHLEHVHTVVRIVYPRFGYASV